MTSAPVRLDDIRFRASGDESTTPVADRPFRPDVEGLRAIAVALVVLYHAGVSRLSGGYVGVDVFFVISGFVITGLLMRERVVGGKNSLLAFYGRRCRRILPASTLVIAATLIASYKWLGFVRGDQIAGDARAAALFVANFHFIALGTNYMSSRMPPSPLQNFWSLAVEEQFYVLYPALFILTGLVLRRWRSQQARLAVLLVAVVGASYCWSIIQTGTNATSAYFSPLTRAWELALGGLVALGVPIWKRLPAHVSASITWIGLGAVLYAALQFGTTTAYPGADVAIPVVGAAVLIVGGTAAPRYGVERLLGLRPFRWLGRISYSLYLWHWPILAIVAQQSITPVTTGTNLLWVVVALALSVLTYFAVENPIRRARYLARHPWASVGTGALLTALSIIVLTFELHSHP